MFFECDFWVCRYDWNEREIIVLIIFDLENLLVEKEYWQEKII